MDFPTLGLNFDLNDLLDGLRRLAQAKDSFKDLGASADRTGDQVEASGRQMSAASLASEAAAFKASRANKNEEDSIRSKMRQLRDLERVMRDIERVENFQKRTDPAIRQYEQQKAGVRSLGQAIELVARDNQRRTRETAEGWKRVGDAIRMAADQTVRAANINAEARVRITQAEIAQNRQGALTRESLAKEAMLVDRLTKELQELGQARAAAARQGAAPGVDADLAGRAAATSVIPVIGAAQSGLNNRGAQLAENEAREKGRRGIMSYMLALVGLGGAYDNVEGKQRRYGNSLTGLGGLMRRLRLAAFDLRFALGALFAGLTLGPLAGMADQMVALESRTRLYAERASDVPYILEETYAVAQRARAGLAGVATLYTRLAPLGDSLGRSQAQLLRVVETVSKAFSIGGAAASEATAAAQQFAQGLSSNRFGGDELRSVAENAPVLLAAIAEGVNQINPALNLNAATFIKWAQAGNANSEILVRALEFAEEKIDKMFASTTPTISQATVVVQNALTKMIDEIDRQAGEAGRRLSTGIAVGLQDFAAFLTKDSTVDAMVGVVNGLKTAFEVAGLAIKGVIDYFPTLLSGLLAITIAVNRLMIVSALTTAMGALGTVTTAVGLAFTGASGRALVLAQAQLAVRNTATAAMAAVGDLAGILTGGILIGVVALVAALNYAKNTLDSASEAMESFGEEASKTYDAIDRARLLTDAYGGEVAGLTALMARAVGMSEQQVKALTDLEAALEAATIAGDAAAISAAQKALADEEARLNAQARAKQDKAMALSSLATARADAVAARASIERGRALLQASAFALRAIANYTQLQPVLGDMTDRAATLAENSVSAASRSIAEYTDLIGIISEAEGLVRNATFEPTKPVDGSGVSDLTNDDDKDGKRMAGAINAIAKMRAEVQGLNAQIRALSADPLSDIAARIIAAGNEAAAGRTAGRGVGFRDEAQRLAMLKEEATIRLELTQSMVEQERAAQVAQEQSRVSMRTNGDAMRAMADYYDQGVRSSERYAAALYAQSEAEVEGRKTMANLAIAQIYGATSISEISSRYQAALATTGELTEEAQAYADALQAQAQRTYDAEAAAIDLNAQLERQQRLNEARSAQRAATDDLEQYAIALRGGAAALDAYNRQKRINAVLEAEGPAPTMVGRILQPLFAALAVDRQDNAAYTAELEERSAEMREQVRLAGLGSRAREIEAEALEIASAAGRKLANEADRAAAAFLIMGREAADLARTIQDSIRDGFIESGKLDFTSLKEGVKRSVRKALYDALIARPVDMVVNAVLDFTQKGLDQILSFIKKSLGGDEKGSMGDALGKFFGDGGKFDAFMSRFGDLGTKLGGFIKGAGQTLGAAGAGYGIGSTVGDIVGLTGSGDGRQQMLDMAASVIGASFGGPVGAALATLASRVLGGFIFDKKRALAVTAVEVQDGRFVSRGALGYDGGPTEEISQAGQELAKMLNKLTTIFGLSLRNAEGLYAVFGWTAGENTKSLGGEGFFGGLLKEFNSIAGLSLDQIKGSALGRGVDLSQVGDAEEALDKIMREVVIRIGETQEVPFTEAEKALIRAAESLEEAAATLKAARNVETDIQRALLEFTNPREFAVQNLRDQQLDRRRGILDLVDQGLITDDRLPGIEEMLRELERAELGDLLGRFAEGLDGVISTLEDLRKAQELLAEYAQGLITGNLSPLSPSARLAASQDEFQRLLAAANAGDATAMERLTSASTDYLSAAQQYFSSSPQYAAIFDQVYQQLLALSEKEFEDPLIGVIEAEVQRLIDAINDGFLLISGGSTTTQPVLPDTPTGPITGGGGTVGGGGTIGGGNSRDTALFGVMERGFESVNQQLANVGQAVVSSQNDGSRTVADAARDVPSFANALNGGRVSQARMSA